MNLTRATLTVALIFVSMHAGAAEHPYAALVARIGGALNVPAPLIHAVIDAESNYQPAAVSKSGAVGLMQLMPKYGGRDAYQYLYNADRIPTTQALKRPEVSIWLGTAYLRILDDHYFEWIKDPALRLRAVIAAYNWGPTAVLDTMFPERRPVSAERFMRRLDQRAPDETQVYVKRVLDTLHLNMTRNLRLVALNSAEP